MADYQDVQIARRITRLARDAQPGFGLINCMVGILVVAMLITFIGTILSG